MGEFHRLLRIIDYLIIREKIRIIVSVKKTKRPQQLDSRSIIRNLNPL